MLERIYQQAFLKDVERAKKRGKNLQKLKTVIDMLLEQKQLPFKYKNHKLKGIFIDCWECHIEPNWLLIYKKTLLAIILVRNGTHADLF